MNKNHTYRVSEIYGPVPQGEGLLTGLPTVFVRFGGCDFRCSWCDSLYAVLPEYRDTWVKMTAQEIADRVFELLPPGYERGHVTFSGGNPVLWSLPSIATMLRRKGVRVAVETQGTIAPPWISCVDDLTLSPKPPSSGNITPYHRGTPLDQLCSWRDSAFITRCLKIVIFTDEDYEYATNVHREYPRIPMILQVGTDVGNSSRDDLLDAVTALQDRVIADPAMFDVQVMAQMHVVLHGHRRGI